MKISLLLIPLGVYAEVNSPKLQSSEEDKILFYVIKLLYHLKCAMGGNAVMGWKKSNLGDNMAVPEASANDHCCL